MAPLHSAGRRLTGTEFEKVSGKEKAKKWKASVRVLHEDGTTGETIGDWLQVRPSVRALQSAVVGPEIMWCWQGDAKHVILPTSAIEWQALF